MRKLVLHFLRKTRMRVETDVGINRLRMITQIDTSTPSEYYNIYFTLDIFDISMHYFYVLFLSKPGKGRRYLRCGHKNRVKEPLKT